MIVLRKNHTVNSTSDNCIVSDGGRAMKCREYSAKQFMKILNNNGYEKVRSKGSHVIFKNAANGFVISIPGVKLNKMIANRLIKENGLIV